MVQFCEVDDAAVVQDNSSYLASALFVAQTIYTACKPDNVGTFLGFVGGTHPEFRQMLGQNAPCTLLLLRIGMLRSVRVVNGGFGGELLWNVKPSASI
jgi:hypothetical protein